MKFFFFLYYVFLVKALSAQNINYQDSINWRNTYQLKGSDFKGVPDTLSNTAALTSTIITYRLYKKDTEYKVVVYCYFLRQASWNLYKNNSTLLKHEQGHFDIAELFARKFRQALKNVNLNSYTINRDIDTILNRILLEKELLDSLYDKETDFCNNIKKQSFWSKKILKEIKDLDNFKR